MASLTSGRMRPPRVTVNQSELAAPARPPFRRTDTVALVISAAMRCPAGVLPASTALPSIRVMVHNGASVIIATSFYPPRSRSPRRHYTRIVRCGELPESGPLFDHVGRQGACRLARGAGVTLKFIRDMGDDHAGHQFPHVQDLGTQNRV